MHVAQVGFFLDPEGRDPAALIRDWPSIVDVAEAAVSAVDRVTVLQACAHQEDFARNAVTYHFVAPPPGAWRGASARACAEAIIDRIATLQPDVVHVHGLSFAPRVARLSKRLKGTPILLQDHADRPPAIWRRGMWRRGAACAAGIALCDRKQLQPFAAAGLLPKSLAVFEIPESTSRFGPGDRDHARRATGMSGDPAVLWVGHLDANKDPLTVLEALRHTAEQLPRLELWCAFGSTALLPEIESQLRTHSHLRSRVHLLGRVPHARVELLMQSADLYVSASHREGSGYALIEALACGLVPVVTDIPSFSALTGDGEVGLLWSPGDPAALAE